MAAKIKILYVLQDLEMGGAERLRFTAEKYINKSRFETIYCCIEKKGVLGEEIERKGGCVICLDTKDEFYNLTATVRLYKVVKKIRPDLVHAALFNANFHARVAGIFSGTPVISEEHGMYFWKKWYHKLIDRILARFTYRIIAASKNVKIFLMKQENIDTEKIEVIYDCVDPESFISHSSSNEARAAISVDNNVYLIGAVGNLRKEKGHDILLDAFREARKRHDARLFIAGDGPLYGYLKQKSEDLGIKDEVRFLRKYSDIAGFLRALDLFVMPSLSEGLGIALIEAVAAGLPCIASNIGGISEIAENFASVTMVKPGDANSLASAIVLEIEKKKIMGSRTQSAGNRVNDLFSPEVYLSHIEELYCRALKRGVLHDSQT